MGIQTGFCGRVEWLHACGLRSPVPDLVWRRSQLLLSRCRKKLIESKEDHARLTGRRGGLRDWVQLKAQQYNVTSALYMLDWWERFIFNIFMASVFIGTQLGLQRVAACPRSLPAACTRAARSPFLQTDDVTISRCGCRHGGCHVRLLSQLGVPLRLERISVRYVQIQLLLGFVVHSFTTNTTRAPASGSDGAWARQTKS
jgi:hypothetical protein